MDPVIGVDVGGTTIKAALLDGRYAELERVERPTPADPAAPAAAVAAEVADVVAALREKSTTRVEGAGVVVPGVVDEQAGIARYAGNLGWRDAPLRDMLAERIAEPVAFGHDVRAGGLAEATLGAATGAGTSLFLPIGTGIAAALITGGVALASGGYAGEIGHLDVGSGKPCVCGSSGCLETVATGPAIAAEYQRRTGLLADGERIVAATANGDPDARAVLDGVLDALRTALTAMTTTFAPEMIVCGGGVFRAGAALLGPLAERLDTALTFQRRPALRAAALGPAAGCIGAGLLARRCEP